MSYGMPRGSNSGGYGGNGVRFPDWVYALGDAFGIKPSTYPGHQETDRREAGYAPNPQRLNRGIDWAAPGAPDQWERLTRFADYLATIPQHLEQVIWRHPHTKRSIEISGGRHQPGYYGETTLSQHENHVHTRQSAPIPLPGGVIPPPPTVTVTTWGIDISNHQGVVDLDRVKAEGFSFVWAKVSEGSSYRDPFWPRTRDDAKRLGLILAGYHYIRTGDAMAQARTFVDHLGDKSIPAMLDFEEGSGNIDMFWAVKNAIESLGVSVRLSYIPDWYWERIGKPDLSKVPGLIASEYVNGTGYASVLYPGNDSPMWKAYGGRKPDILQFTDRATVTGRPMDANAFRGTPDQLRALLAGKPAGEDDWLNMPSNQEKLDFLYNEFSKLFASRSPYDPTRKRNETAVGFILNSDRTGHMKLVEDAALAGESWAVFLVSVVAEGKDDWPGNWLWYNGPDGKPVKDQWAIEHAQSVFARIPKATKAKAWDDVTAWLEAEKANDQ